MDQIMEKAKIGPELLQSLGRGMRTLTDSAQKLGNLASVSASTNEYAQHVRQASQSLAQLNQSYANTISAMGEMSKASENAKQFHAQVQTITKNLTALNAVYEMELKDTNSHIKAMGSFYKNVSGAMESIAQAGKNSQQFQQELSRLTSNVSSLNKVYGSMLSAMRS
jgi:gliding motility-associated protein GldL